MRWLLLLFSGCLYSPSVGDGVLACAGSSPQCPDGYYCAPDAHCWKSGHLFTGDGGGSGDGGSSDDMAAPMPCSNGALDDGEADIDCGGVCAPAGCALGKHCNAAGDCESQICNLKRSQCVMTTCDDGLRGQGESDVDCGGTVCTGCATGQACTMGADCANHLCNAAQMLCVASTCEDGEQDGTETDVDCGGSCAAKCKVGKGCMVPSDCVSPATCDTNKHQCSAAQCVNSMEDIDNPGAVPPISAESDVDCGGVVCAPCAVGQKCFAGSDCLTGSCHVGTKHCVADACQDGALNGSEADVDCAGSCPNKCADGQMCKGAGDCASAGAICTSANTCCVPSGTACNGFACGTKMDNCGQTFVCGANGGSCQSGSFACVNNQCCQTQAATCSGKCDFVNNNCGQSYDCGGCLTGYFCSASLQQCCLTQANACAGKPCQVVSDGCGSTYTCDTTGCTSGQVCFNAACCTKRSTTSACSGHACDTVSDGCGGTYHCAAAGCASCGGGGAVKCCGDDGMGPCDCCF